MTNMYYPPPPSPPSRKKLYRKKPHTSYLACSAWDLHDQKDKADLERVQAMCMVFNYSVDSIDFRHKNSVLLLLEKHRSNESI